MGAAPHGCLAPAADRRLICQELDEYGLALQAFTAGGSQAVRQSKAEAKSFNSRDFQSLGLGWGQ